MLCFFIFQISISIIFFLGLKHLLTNHICGNTFLSFWNHKLRYMIRPLSICYNLITISIKFSSLVYFFLFVVLPCYIEHCLFQSHSIFFIYLYVLPILKGLNSMWLLYKCLTTYLHTSIVLSKNYFLCFYLFVND